MEPCCKTVSLLGAVLRGWNEPHGGCMALYRVTTPACQLCGTPLTRAVLHGITLVPALVPLITLPQRRALTQSFTPVCYLFLLQ